MSSCAHYGYFQSTVDLPKQPKIEEKTTEKYEIPIPKYELYPAASCFDPNHVGSPPNNFTSMLQQRMESYYSDSPVNKNIQRARDRAISVGNLD